MTTKLDALNDRKAAVEAKMSAAFLDLRAEYKFHMLAEHFSDGNIVGLAISALHGAGISWDTIKSTVDGIEEMANFENSLEGKRARAKPLGELLDEERSPMEYERERREFAARQVQA